MSESKWSKESRAAKFATAFLRTYKDQSFELYPSLDIIEEHLNNHKLFFKTLHFSSTRIEDKQDVIKNLSKQLSLPKELSLFLCVLVQHKALFILKQIIDKIRSFYKKQHDLIDVYITSSSPLGDEEKQSVESSLQETFNGTLSFFYDTDDRLISGVKIQTDTYYWESSVRQRIREIEHKLNV